MNTDLTIVRALALELSQFGKVRCGGGGKPLTQDLRQFNVLSDGIALLHLKGEVGLPVNGNSGRRNREHRLGDLHVVAIKDFLRKFIRTGRVTDTKDNPIRVSRVPVLRRVPVLIDAVKGVVRRTVNIGKSDRVVEHVILHCFGEWLL
jgi:hypothetical protein